MKKTLLAVMMSTAMMPALVQAATVNTGTLTINGEITAAAANTCTMTAGDSGSVFTLTSVTTADFPLVDSAAPAQPFDLKFASCSTGVNSVTLNLDGEPDGKRVTAFKNIAEGSGAAAGVAVEIKGGTNTAVITPKVDAVLTPGSDGSSNDIVVPLQVSIIRTGVDPVTTGAVKVMPVVKITYN